MDTKDYLVEVKIRNNWLMKKIREAGFENGAQFSKAHHFQPNRVGEYLTFKKTPYNKKGEWRADFIRISEALHCLPEDLCPPQHLEQKLKKNKSEFEANLQDVAGYLMGNADTAIPAIDHIIEQENIDTINNSLNELTPREAQVIKCLFGFTDKGEMTLRETGEILNLSGTRISHIAAKALRKLRHPARNNNLLDVFREKIGGSCYAFSKPRHYTPEWKKIEAKLEENQREIDRKFKESLDELQMHYGT